MDTFDKVRPHVLIRDTTIMALTAFWIADRPERLASPWPPEKTAHMLVDKHDDVMLKLFGLWPFGNLGSNGTRWGWSPLITRLPNVRTKGSRNTLLKFLFGIVAVTAINVFAAQAQESAQPPASFRQSLDDAWWTGPMLAPSANTLPKGHFLIEPYLYDVITTGFYNSHGARVSAAHQNSFGSLTYALYGVANKFTVGMIPTFGYNEVSNGPSSSGVGVGDLTVQAQYRLHLFQEGSWIPTMSIALQETLPTAKYDQLGSRPSNGLGGGAFTTSPGVYSQTFFWLPNGRILRMRFNVVPSFSRNVSLRDASVYGTSAGFRGRAKPGPSVFVDAAWEYSMTTRWVLALDATYRHQGNTPVHGYYVVDPTQAVRLNSGTSDAFGLAPAIEYNWKRNLGVLLGVRLIPAGRNMPVTISPAMAVNFVH